MVATWDNDNSMTNEEEVDEDKDDEIENFYFMVKDQEDEVKNEEPESLLSYDELHDSFENLIKDFHKVNKILFNR